MSEPVVSEYAASDYLPHLEQAADRFALLLAEGDLQAPVPPCPGWQLADLGAHLGRIHQWANHAVVEGNPDNVPTPTPADRDGLVEWYRQASGTLLTTLTNTDPAEPAWGFGPHPRTAAFWYRRQAHETAVHLWDAAASQGDSIPVDAELAADGVDEAVTFFFPRQVRLGRIPALTGSLALSTEGIGAGRRWVLAGDGVGPASASDAVALATVHGPAEALYLLIWRRIGLDDLRLTIEGDRDAAVGVLNAGVTP
jgi:uncharacterized protein (TIGR03083 family)